MTQFPGAIAIDWGTSSFRAYRIGEGSEIAERVSAPLGILKVSGGNFEAVFDELVGHWVGAHNDHIIIMSGMIGSRQGWHEAPYASCPANLASLSSNLEALHLSSGREVWIVPGLSYRGPGGTPDVMRGEETQILGAIDLIADPGALICLPGTHSKWVTLDAGSVAKFETHMTGEAFEALGTHTILAAMMEPGPTNEEAFCRGLDRSAEGGGLLNHLFGIRTHGLFGDLSAERSASYLSGLLIGHEIRAASTDRLPETVHLIGDGALVERYESALSHLGIGAIRLPDDLAARGLGKLAKVIAAREGTT